MLSCCGCMCMMYAACLSFLKNLTFMFDLSLIISRLFVLLQVEKMLHRRCSKFLEKIQEPFFVTRSLL
ncbi:hypothetical protein AMTRI_Chr05g60990 [Amborella trichopoda]